MKAVVLRRVLPQLWPDIAHFHLPLYVVVPFRLFLSVLAVVLGLLVLTRTQPIPDPFAAYLSLIRENAVENTALQVIPAWTTNLFAGVTYARFRDPGPFLMIHLTFANGVIESVRFITREGLLKVGDLTLLWGKPEIQVTGYVVWLSWLSPEIRAIAIAPPDCGGGVYFAPVVHVTFSGFQVDRRRSPQ